MGRAEGAQLDDLEDVGLLLVEDDDGDALLVEDELAERLPRARIVRSRSLSEALEHMGPSVDCVLLDLGLPDAAGLEAVAKLRAQAPAVALIVLTGLNDEAAGIAAVGAGAQDYLIKGTVDGEQLARSIRYSVGRRRIEHAERSLLLAQAQAREMGRLERGLAPSLKLGDPAMWVASIYRAGRSRALLGGDFFDLLQLSDGTVSVVIGDVCGHGPDEAAVGVSLRASWRALALAGAGPAAATGTLQEVIEHERQLPGLFATLCTLEIEPSRSSAAMVRAGHPRPLLIVDQVAAPVSSSGSGVAGIGMGAELWEAERIALPPSWTLLLYTDGIIDGRVGAGPERLGEAGLKDLIEARISGAPAWRADPEALLSEVIADAERLHGGTLNDDVAMLLLGTSHESDDVGPG